MTNAVTNPGARRCRHAADDAAEVDDAETLTKNIPQSAPLRAASIVPVRRAQQLVVVAPILSRGSVRCPLHRGPARGTPPLHDEVTASRGSSRDAPTVSPYQRVVGRDRRRRLAAVEARLRVEVVVVLGAHHVSVARCLAGSLLAPTPTRRHPARRRRHNAFSGGGLALGRGRSGGVPIGRRQRKRALPLVLLPTGRTAPLEDQFAVLQSTSQPPSEARADERVLRLDLR